MRGWGWGGAGWRGAPWTHCETNADSGGEGPWDELALVVLNEQRGLAHSAVSHQDGLRRERDMTSCDRAVSSPEARTLCGQHSVAYCTGSSAVAL